MKTMRITKIHFGHRVGKYDPCLGTELPRDFCSGIGPLQLGVVLVFMNVIYVNSIFLKFLFCKYAIKSKYAIAK